MRSLAAKLRKKSDDNYESYTYSKNETTKKDSTYKSAEKELENIFGDISSFNISIKGDKVYLLPDMLPDISGINVIRAGVLAGEFKKGRFEPAHSLFTAFRPDAFRRVLELDINDRRTEEYLHGMETECDGENGYTAVSFCGMVTGFGKCSGGRLKNKYPKGLRN